MILLEQHFEICLIRTTIISNYKASFAKNVYLSKLQNFQINILKKNALREIELNEVRIISILFNFYYSFIQFLII